MVSVGRGLGHVGVHVYRPVDWRVEESDPKALLGVTGELLQESVQPRSRNTLQGMRLVLPVLKLVICNV